jgi:acetyl-CoA carboxylase carboxyltransferase component
MTEKTKNVYEEFREKRNALRISSNLAKVEKVHANGKLTAEERMSLLFDSGTFVETNPWAKNRCTDFDLYKKDMGTEGVMCGYGDISGRSAFAYANDATVMGGSLGEAGRHKVITLMDKAMDAGYPIIALNDAAGARIQEGVGALHAYCSIFGKTSVASGWVPQISIIMGLCAGGTSYCSALTDFIIQVDPVGKMFITGPAVIESVTGEKTTFDDIGGARVHGNITGLTHFVVGSEEEAMALTKRLLSFLPSNSKETPPRYAESDPIDRKTPELMNLIPLEPLKAFDVKEVIKSLADHGDFLEVQQGFATNMVVGFIRLGGETIGVVANQPKVLAGCIDVNASWKAARFVRFCDSFNIPLVTLADTPGYLPGVNQEHAGIIRNGAKMLFAYSESTVPKVTIVLRKNYGGAYSAMCGKGMGADFVLSLPTGELAIMGAEGAANIVFKKEIDGADDKVAKRKELTEDYKEKFLNPYRGAEYGVVDDIVEPEDLRKTLISSLRIIRNKTANMPYKKHSNIPL